MVGLLFGRFGQSEDLLLRHAGWNGDVALLKRREVLMVGRSRPRVTNV